LFYIYIFLDYFNVLILKIIFLKKNYFDAFPSRKYFKLFITILIKLVVDLQNMKGYVKKKLFESLLK